MSGPRRRAFTVVMDWADVEKWASPVYCAADFSHWLGVVEGEAVID